LTTLQGANLLLEQTPEFALSSQQHLRWAFINDLPSFTEDNHTVGYQHRREAVGDHEDWEFGW